MTSRNRSYFHITLPALQRAPNTVYVHHYFEIAAVILCHFNALNKHIDDCITKYFDDCFNGIGLLCNPIAVC